LKSHFYYIINNSAVFKINLFQLFKKTVPFILGLAYIGIFGGRDQNMKIHLIITVRLFIINVLFLGLSFKTFCQPNDEKTENKGTSYRHFEAFHEVEDLKSNYQDKTSVHNIILMIGDGMGAAQIYSGLVANKGKLYLTQFPVTGLSITNSSNDLITDSSAGATAYSTGKKTKNGYVALDSHRKPLETILEYAETKGLSTGMVVTSAITHATPASFIAHVISRNLYEDIADFFLKTNIDVFMGGGRDFFNGRTDGINLISELEKKDYQILYTVAELDSIKSSRVAGLFWKEHGPSIRDGRGNMLAKSTGKSIEILSQNKKGFFLMVEGSQIDWGGHQNDTRYLVEEMLDFDRAVGEALKFAIKDGHTLIVVTADHETGGFAITGGNIKKGSVIGSFLTDGHTGVWVPVFAFGPGCGIFTGTYDNTSIYFKMRELMDEGLVK
jgi:alkaline phosphatase